LQVPDGMREIEAEDPGVHPNPTLCTRPGRFLPKTLEYGAFGSQLMVPCVDPRVDGGCAWEKHHATWLASHWSLHVLAPY
jgi:hypothetical protein